MWLFTLSIGLLLLKYILVLVSFNECAHFTEGAAFTGIRYLKHPLIIHSTAVETKVTPFSFLMLVG
jgi:hypothetical protein